MPWSASTAVEPPRGKPQGIPTVERFRYLYDRAELAEWTRKIRELSTQARETHVLMNNCYANYGPTNARELAALLLDLEAGPA